MAGTEPAGDSRKKKWLQDDVLASLSTTKRGINLVIDVLCLCLVHWACVSLVTCEPARQASIVVSCGQGHSYPGFKTKFCIFSLLACNFVYWSEMTVSILDYYSISIDFSFSFIGPCITF